MKKFKASITLLLAVVFISWLAAVPTIAQTAGAKPAALNLPRTADGKPNLNGIWQALNTAAWDIQDHTGQLGEPPGRGVVEGDESKRHP